MGRRCMGGRREAAYKYSQINDVTVCVRKSFAKKVIEQNWENFSELETLTIFAPHCTGDALLQMNRKSSSVLILESFYLLKFPAVLQLQDSTTDLTNYMLQPFSW